jgi:hypothetical protein
MHKARAFFFVCAGLLCLALAYHLGATSAKAQSGDRTIAAANFGACGSYGVQGFVMTPNGDVYWNQFGDGGCPPELRYVGNFWSGAPTPAVSQPTWGQVKAKYATPAPGKVTR